MKIQINSIDLEYTKKVGLLMFILPEMNGENFFVKEAGISTVLVLVVHECTGLLSKVL